jgi:hypothetical protein
MIEAILLLMMDNYLLWRNQVKNMLDLQDLTKKLKGVKDATLLILEDVQLRTILTSKLDSSIYKVHLKLGNLFAEELAFTFPCS